VHEQLQPGHLVGVGGPRNNFPLVPSERYVFVAGGIGITPLLPMVQQADLLGADWRLLYLGRSRRTMAFLDELARYGDRVRIAPQDEVGLLDLPAFLRTAPDGVRVYCCGPAPLLAAIETACAGWPPHSLRTERFVADELAAPARESAFEVELARSGRRVEVPVYERAQFTPGACVAGPALVIEDGTSTFVTDRFDVMLDAGGALVLERKGNGPSPFGA
jgi:ferredoxin-NADP reductase